MSESTPAVEPAPSGRRRRFPLTLGPSPERETPGPAVPEPSAEPRAVVDSVPGAGLAERGEGLAVGQAGDVLAGDLGRVLRSLRTPAIWVDPHGMVRWAHPALEAVRIVRRRTIGVPEVAAMVDAARRSDQVVQRDMSLKRPGRRQPRLSLRVRVSPMEDGSAFVLVEDMTEAERLDHVRRDFVANVSHELKTPIGALSLLAEAVAEGRDDPEAVARFSARMVIETRRLTTLVNDLMDLSRLEGIDPLHPMAPVLVDDVVAQACEDVRLLAREQEIRLLRGGITGLSVLGVESQLTTAVRNLLLNAINYSPANTKVAVSTGQAEGSVTIAVTDQGIGIPTVELDRIFERFYRVDQARSRDTGGTGLGLAIVKHVCANHGGHCDVWSRVGEGSTFTIRLPELGEGKKRGRPSPPKEDT